MLGKDGTGKRGEGIDARKGRYRKKCEGIDFRKGRYRKRDVEYGVRKGEGEEWEASERLG